MTTKKMKIGECELLSNISLAPMAGITDFVYRKLIRDYSKDCLLTTEMLSSEAIIHNSTNSILHTEEYEHPIAFQISGHKPDIMAKSASIIENKATIIDINMGCPVNKIVKAGDGSALMQTPQLAFDIVQAIKDSVKIPVTVKFRLGFTAETKNFVEFAQLMQKAGADAITLHARTRTQMYSGKADWEEIRKLKKNIDLPVFANGDINSVKDAIECLKITKADGLAIGRGSISKPYLFKHLEHYFKTGEILEDLTIGEKIAILKKHLALEMQFRGEENGIKFMRKFYTFYIEKIRNASVYRFALVRENEYDKIISILDGISQ